jgi:hypothetical protein
MPPKTAEAPVRQERKRKRRETMSTREWNEYQRQVARERQQKYRARAAGKETSAAAPAGSSEQQEVEEVRRDVAGSASHHEHHIHSIASVNLSKWHNQYSSEDLALLDMQCEGRFSDEATELESLVAGFVSTLLPGYKVAQLHARMGPMSEPAYFQRQKSSRQSRTSQRLSEAIDYMHLRLLLIPGMFSLLHRVFSF